MRRSTGLILLLVGYALCFLLVVLIGEHLTLGWH